MTSPLFILRSPHEILNLYGKKPKSLSRYAYEKLSRCDNAKKDNLPDILQRLIGCSVSAEVVFLNDNGMELYTEFPHLNDSYLALADDGQGDLWMIRLTDGMIVFFDHGKEDDPIIPLSIDFYQFLQLADLIAQWDQFLDTEPENTTEQEAALWKEIKKIEPNLLKTYPFSLQ